MAKYEAQNRNVIARAFSRFRKEEEDIIREGMVKVAEAGLDFLLEAHEIHPIAHHHPEEENTMGYAVAHDGVIVESAGYNGGRYDDDMPGLAREEAERLLAGTKGWAVIILSDMGKFWYNEGWEIDFLQYSADEVAENFHNYFKPI